MYSSIAIDNDAAIAYDYQRADALALKKRILADVAQWQS